MQQYIAAFALALVLVLGIMTWIANRQLDLARKDNATLKSNEALCEAGQAELRGALDAIQASNAAAEAAAKAEIERQAKAAASAQELLDAMEKEVEVLRVALAADAEYAAWAAQPTPPEVAETVGE